MGLRDIETRLPPGFRFYPSDEELVCHYLHNKVTSRRFAGASPAGTMIEVDLHVHEPWELPGLLISNWQISTTVTRSMSALHED
jgi:hypothetical protein